HDGREQLLGGLLDQERVGSGDEEQGAEDGEHDALPRVVHGAPPLGGDANAGAASASTSGPWASSIAKPARAASARGTSGIEVSPTSTGAAFCCVRARVEATNMARSSCSNAVLVPWSENTTSTLSSSSAFITSAMRRSQ